MVDIWSSLHFSGLSESLSALCSRSEQHQVLSLSDGHEAPQSPEGPAPYVLSCSSSCLFTLVPLFLVWLPLAICIPPWPESLVALMAILQILGHIGCENMIFPLTLSPSLVFKVTPQQSGS